MEDNQTSGLMPLNVTNNVCGKACSCLFKKKFYFPQEMEENKLSQLQLSALINSSVHNKGGCA